MAAAILRRRLEELGVHERVSSAGLLQGGVPASPGALAALAARGIDLSSHRAAVLTPQLLASADVVVGMTREHVREAVVAVPATWPRCFTLKELVRRGSEAGRRGAHERISDWLERVHQGRELADSLGASPADDIADPMGMDGAAYEATAVVLDELMAELVGLVWGARAPRRARARVQGS